MATKPDIQRWLEVNAFYCPHLNCTMSPRQCEANRKRPKLGDPVHSLVRQPVMPRACETCTDWPKFFEEVEEKKKALMEEVIMPNETKSTKSGKKKSKVKAPCQNCGRERWLKAKGLCSACYRAKYGKVTVTLQIPVSLYEVLQKEAELHFRNPADQVLAILTDYFIKMGYDRKQLLNVDAK